MKKTTKPSSLAARQAARKLRLELIQEIENDNPLLGEVRGAGLKASGEAGGKG